MARVLIGQDELVARLMVGLISNGSILLRKEVIFPPASKPPQPPARSLEKDIGPSLSIQTAPAGGHLNVEDGAALGAAAKYPGKYGLDGFESKGSIGLGAYLTGGGGVNYGKQFECPTHSPIQECR